MTFVDILTVAVLAFVGFRLVSVARVAVRPPVRARIIGIVTGVRFRHVVAVPFLLAAVVAAAALLLRVPGLDWGWWSALGGYGNPVTGGTERTIGTPLAWAVPLVFALLLVPGLALFAEAEERMFRQGAEHESMGRRAWRGVAFGLVHAVVGIPVGVALALSLAGWWFTAVYLWGYRRGGAGEALLESTRAHAAYNGVIVLLLLVTLALGFA